LLFAFVHLKTTPLSFTILKIVSILTLFIPATIERIILQNVSQLSCYYNVDVKHVEKLPECQKKGKTSDFVDLIVKSV